MASNLTTAEQMLLAQLAYLDFDGFEGEGRSVQDVLDAVGNKKDNLSQLQKDAYDNIQTIIKEQNIDGLDNWKVEAVCNDNEKGGSGYYGLFITKEDPNTGKKEGLITSRGTEFNGDKAIPDVIADGTFLDDINSNDQERRAEKFMQDIWYKYGDKVDSFELDGHSLGGHLVFHMALTAPIAMRNKINNVISWDGPGSSKEQSDYYKSILSDEEYKKITEKMTHYRISIIGGCLPQIDGVTRKFIDTKGEGLLDKHSLKNIIIVDGEPVFLDETVFESKMAEWFTKFMDDDTAVFDLWKTTVKFFSGINPFLLMLPPVVYVPLLFIEGVVMLVETVVVLAKVLINVWNKFKDVIRSIGQFIDDIKYKYFKPKVSGIYEVYPSRMIGIASELENQIRAARNKADDAEAILLTMRYEWDGCAFLKSFIKSSIRRINGDINKLEKMKKVLTDSAERYSRADDSVGALFA